MLNLLYKKAHGYTVNERIKEYGYDEEGKQRLIKEKVQSKHIPPDISAIKAYMESKEKQLFEMTEEQLKEEKYRLLKKLQKIEQTGGENVNKISRPTNKRSKRRF